MKTKPYDTGDGSQNEKSLLSYSKLVASAVTENGTTISDDLIKTPLHTKMYYEKLNQTVPEVLFLQYIFVVLYI